MSNQEENNPVVDYEYVHTGVGFCNTCYNDCGFEDVYNVHKDGSKSFNRHRCIYCGGDGS